MARKDEEDVRLLEVDEEEDNQRAGWVLNLFFGHRRRRQDGTIRRQAISPLLVMILMLPVIVGAAYFAFNGTPEAQISLNPPAAANVEMPQANPLAEAEQPDFIPEQAPQEAPPQLQSEPEVVV
jgi:hypothetical protein